MVKRAVDAVGEVEEDFIVVEEEEDVAADTVEDTEVDAVAGVGAVIIRTIKQRILSKKQIPER